MGWGGRLSFSRVGSGDGVSLGGCRRVNPGGVCRRGLGVAGLGGGLCVVRLWPGPGGGAEGDVVGVALLVAGGAGMGAVLDRSLGVLLGRVGVACACRAVLADPGLPRWRGMAGRWLPGHPGRPVVRRQRVAAGGWCLLAWVRVGGGCRWWWGAPCRPWCCWCACMAPCWSMGAYGGPNVASLCSGGGRWCRTV